MEAIATDQIPLMLWVQAQHTPALDTFFEVFTRFGGEYYLLMVPLVLWCLDYRVGARIALLMAITLFVNTTLKNWVQEPRPYQLDPAILSAGAEGYSFPSGHAMLVVAFWGVLAAWVRRTGFWWLAVGVMLTMAASRVYLGVHFPLDVAVGLALGGGLLWLALYEDHAIEVRLASRTLAERIGIAAALGALLFAFDALLVPDELHEHMNAGSAGFLAGSGVGVALARARLAFEGRGVWWKRGLRFVLGAALTLALLGGLRSVGAPAGAFQSPVIALELAAFGLFITFAVPWLFVRSRLAG